MASTNPAAQAVAEIIRVQQALTVIGTLNLFAYQNPYSACVENNTAFDYIIVGGGTSGAVLGTRLSEDRNVTVLVIEAGYDFPLEVAYPYTVLYTKRSRFDWNYTTLPDENFAQCHRYDAFKPILGKVLGGESSMNYMIYSQGQSTDYDEWAKITNESSWSYSNVLRLFKKLENFKDEEIANSPDRIYHGFNGYLNVTKERYSSNDGYFKAFEQVGIKHVLDINNGTKVGYTSAAFYIDRYRQNTARAYLDRVRDRSNLFILKNTLVKRIIIDDNKRAIGVEAISNDNRTFVFKARKEVEVAAGVFNTAKLLQLSGVGPKEVLDRFNIPVIADLPVGMNYQDPVAVVATLAVENTCAMVIPENIDPYKFPSPTIVGNVPLNKSSPYPDYRTEMFSVPETPATVLLRYTPFVFGFSDNIVNCWYEKIKGKKSLFAMVKTFKPKSRGQVRIRSRSPYDPPIIDARYLSNEADVDDLVEALKDFLKVLQSPYFKENGAFFVDAAKGKCGQYRKYSNDYWRCYVRCLMAPAGNHAGTTALGRVVDGRLRVYGVSGLRCVDAGIIPFAMANSNTVPTMMIGENAAEMIKQDNREN